MLIVEATCFITDPFSDIGMLTLNQYILLDPILLFFISGATYTLVKFRTFEVPMLVHVG
jgi:hypothetical protein